MSGNHEAGRGGLGVAFPKLAVTQPHNVAVWLGVMTSWGRIRLRSAFLPSMADQNVVITIQFRGTVEQSALNVAIEWWPE